MSDTILQYVAPRTDVLFTPNKGRRSRAAPRKCERTDCDTIFAPPRDRKDQRYCSQACANRANIAVRWQARCHGCGARFVPTDAEQVYCSDACEGTEDPHGEGAPYCCGQALSFGTDGHGRTTQTCHRCGTRLVAVRGKRVYDQRARHQVELDKLYVKGVSRVPGAGHRRGKKGRAEWLDEEVAFIGTQADNIHDAIEKGRFTQHLRLSRRRKRR